MGNGVGRIAAAMLLVLVSGVSQARDDRSLSYLDLLESDPGARIATAEFLTETERGHMAEYLAGAGPDLAARLQEVTARLGCKNGPVAADQQGYLQQILVEIYAAHVRQAMHRFELLYGDRATQLLDVAQHGEADMASIVRTNFAACGGVPEMQTALSE